MTIAEPFGEPARPSPAMDVEPLWRVQLASGMVTLTLDQLDAAFQESSITLHTLVAREGERQLRPLGVVAGLFEEAQPAEAAWGRAACVPGVSGVRPAFPGRAPSEPAWSEAAQTGAPQHWQLRIGTALSLPARRAMSWLWACAPYQRWALGGTFVAAVVTAVTVLRPTQIPPRALPSAAPAAALRPSLTRAAPAVSEERSLAPLGAAVHPAARAVEPAAEFEPPIPTLAERHGSGRAERAKATLGAGTKHSTRRHKSSKRRASRD